MKKVFVRHNMPMEFMTMLLRCALGEHFKNYIKENGYLKDDEIEKIFEAINSEMSIFMKKDIEVLIKAFRMNFYYPVMVIGEESIENLGAFLDRIKSINGKDYMRICFDLCSADVVFDDDDSLIQEKIAEKYGTADADLFLEFKRNPEEMKRRLDDLLHTFYTGYFKKYESFIEERVKEKVDIHQKKFQENPEEFLKVIGNGDYSKALEDDFEFKIYLCYLEEFTPRYLSYKKTHMFLYGFSEDQKFEWAKRGEHSKEIFKILADETRMEILRLVSKKKWHRNHLVKQMGLTSATMTYHLNKLVSLGMIDVVANEEGKKAQYAINSVKLRTLVDAAVNDILKG